MSANVTQAGNTDAVEEEYASAEFPYPTGKLSNQAGSPSAHCVRGGKRNNEVLRSAGRGYGGPRNRETSRGGRDPTHNHRGQAASHHGARGAPASSHVCPAHVKMMREKPEIGFRITDHLR